MSRRMSCAHTTTAVRDRTKTVTRRRADTWTTLAAGDRLTLVKQSRGLTRGSRQVVLAEVEVVDVRVEPLNAITDFDVVAEGVTRGWTRNDFIRFWLGSHGYNADTAPHDIPVRRIEWRYLEAT